MHVHQVDICEIRNRTATWPVKKTMQLSQINFLNRLNEVNVGSNVENGQLNVNEKLQSLLAIFATDFRNVHRDASDSSF